MNNQKIKTAIVAGCGGVVGRALVENLIVGGARVVGLVRSGSEDRVRNLVSKFGDNFSVASGDMTDPAEGRKLVTSAFEKLGAVNSYFHTVGTFEWKTWSDASSDTIDSLWKSNFLTSSVMGVKVFEAMSAQKDGLLMFVSNRDTLTMASMGFGPYLASKAALNMFVQSLASEGKAKGVRVNAVLPTIIDTEENRKAMPDKDPKDWVNPIQLADLMIHIAGPSGSTITGGLYPMHGRLV